MMGLPDGVKSLTICLPVLTECTNVTETHTHTHTHTHTERETDGHCMTAKAALDASIAWQKLGRDVVGTTMQVQFEDGCGFNVAKRLL